MLNVEELFSQIVLQVSLASRSTLSKIKWEPGGITSLKLEMNDVCLSYIMCPT